MKTLFQGLPVLRVGIGSSTLHIGWGLCDSLCQVVVCRDRYGLGGVLLFILGSNLGGVGPERGLRGGGGGGWCEKWAGSG